MGLPVNLLQAARLDGINRVAVVGAGGKTTALFQLARQSLAAGRPNVLLSATTHLGVDQARWADRHLEITEPGQVTYFLDNLPPGVTLFTGPRIQNEQRTAGLSGASLEAVQALSRHFAAPLFIEADGARQRPLKAPAGHEPPIPTWVETVLVIAGLSGLGRPLNTAWVHRPEIFAQLSGLATGQPVTSAALVHVLTSPLGGLKNIPPSARRVALLNQADSPTQQASGAQLAEQLIKNGYSAALVASLAPASGVTGQVWQVAEPIAGIILAAGGSSRYGLPKQLLDWRGVPAVRFIARTALEAGLWPVVVVTGANAAAVQAAVSDLPVQTTYNSQWAAGQSASIAAGLGSLPPNSGGAVFLLSDQPQTPPTLLRSLVSLHAETLAPIIVPLIDGQRGNPVLFDCRTFLDLGSLQGDAGGRALFSHYPLTWLPWHDPTQLLDIDRPDDYQRLLAFGQAQNPARETGKTA
jgi:molybdenum cofactor cytidylyltransferase